MKKLHFNYYVNIKKSENFYAILFLNNPISY